jgi:hypothetical protein
MEKLFILALMYLAVGAAFFAHPLGGAEPDDFHWRSQVRVFLDTLPAVLTWPLALWRMAKV